MFSSRVALQRNPAVRRVHLRGRLRPDVVVRRDDFVRASHKLVRRLAVHELVVASVETTHRATSPRTSRFAAIRLTDRTSKTLTCECQIADSRTILRISRSYWVVRCLSVSNSISGGDRELNEVPAVGNPTHLVQIGRRHCVSVGERLRRVALQGGVQRAALW